MNEQSGDMNWRNNLRYSLPITSGIILTVMMALLMSQIDLLQVRLHPTPVLVAALQPTAENNPSLSKLTGSSLATPTKTPAPTATSSGIPTATAVPMLIHCGAIPDGWTGFTVSSGDTLLSLSASAGTTAAAIVKANCIQNEFVSEGMIIFLPVRPPTAVPCGPPSWWVRYMVQPGDTLSYLAVSTGTTVFAIMQGNCLDSTYLTAGRTLYLPRYPYTPPTATRPVIPTPFSTWTATPILVSPTATVATATAVVTPSATSILTVTATATTEPVVTDTATPPSPTATTDATATLPPTNTSEPPTASPLPLTATSAPPTATAVPPSATPIPATAVPPSATP